MKKFIFLFGYNQGGYVNICEKAFYEKNHYLNDEFNEDLNDLLDKNGFYELAERTYEIPDEFRIGDVVVDKYGPVWPDPRKVDWDALKSKLESMGFEHSLEAEKKFVTEEDEDDYWDSDADNDDWEDGNIPYGKEYLPIKEES